MIKKFKVKKSSVIIILDIFIILIIDKDYFYASYIQSTPDIMFPFGVLLLSNLVILHFIPIFDVIYISNLFKLSFIIIPLYMGILMIISKGFIKR